MATTTGALVKAEVDGTGVSVDAGWVAVEGSAVGAPWVAVGGFDVLVGAAWVAVGGFAEGGASVVAGTTVVVGGSLVAVKVGVFNG